MRIVILADPLDNQSAGIHIYTKEMVKALLKYDTQNEYILIRQKKKDDFSGVEQYVIPNFPKIILYPTFRLFVIIPLFLRKLKADAVLEPAHFGPFNLPKKIKRITIIHDLTPILFPHLHRFHSQLLQKIFLEHILKQADLIISNSKNTNDDINMQYPFTKGKVKCIYLGKNDDFRRSEKADVITKFNLEEHYFLSVGTIEPRKNLLTLLEAFETFRDKNEDFFKLIIVGKKGWKTKKFFSALKKHPYRKDIYIVGYVSTEELTVLYSKATALIYPSFYEGFGLPVLEAMSCGTACIVSNSSSLPEVGGDAVEYFDPANSDELSSTMLELCKNTKKRQVMSEKSLNQAAKFSWKTYAERFIVAVRNLSS